MTSLAYRKPKLQGQVTKYKLSHALNDCRNESSSVYEGRQLTDTIPTLDEQPGVRVCSWFGVVVAVALCTHLADA